jgi:hypothetical protein
MPLPDVPGRGDYDTSPAPRPSFHHGPASRSARSYGHQHCGGRRPKIKCLLQCGSLLEVAADFRHGLLGLVPTPRDSVPANEC